ncbi:hypothetical protein RF55_26451 [Lasius niger]|uniref:Uncharacterized protein n=1 Tax=Lasius niger TaxID=67767 RepID=A0A0J7JTQ2_LASNI|nr:hypothetical protein RF55_26451 [Lasius niger]
MSSDDDQPDIQRLRTKRDALKALIEEENDKAERICQKEPLDEQDREDLHVCREVLRQFKSEWNEINELIQENCPVEEVKDEVTNEKKTQEVIIRGFRKIQNYVKVKEESGEATPIEMKNQVVEKPRLQLPRACFLFASKK